MTTYIFQYNMTGPAESIRIMVGLKVTQINYVSRNQLHSTPNLSFGWFGKKEKHCWALSTNFLVQFS